MSKKENKLSKIFKNNPLITRSALPYEAPPFDKIQGKHFAPAVDWAVARIHVEVHRELVPSLLLVVTGEVVLHVVSGAVQALLFAGPDADTDGAPRLNTHGFENAHGFHRDGGAVRVVRCAW